MSLESALVVELCVYRESLNLTNTFFLGIACCLGGAMMTLLFFFFIDKLMVPCCNINVCQYKITINLYLFDFF